MLRKSDLFKTASSRFLFVNVNVRHAHSLNPVTEGPDDATEGVTEHSFLGFNHQSTCMPSYSLYFSCSIPNVLPRRDEGSDKSCAVIEALAWTWKGLFRDLS